MKKGKLGKIPDQEGGGRRRLRSEGSDGGHVSTGGPLKNGKGKREGKGKERKGKEIRLALFMI